MIRSFPIVAVLLIGCSGGTPVPNEKAKQLGITVYPGATVTATPEKPSTAAAGEKNVRLFLTSPDSAQKVADYYAKETGIKAVAEGKGFSLMGKGKSGAFLLMGIEPDGAGCKVTASGLVAN